MDSPVGYSIAYTDTKQYQRANTFGSFYTYVLAGNGLFVTARNEHMTGAVPLGLVPVRGLMEQAVGVHLLRPRVPAHLLELAVSIMSIDVSRERYLAIVWEGGGWRLVMPEQTAHPMSVSFQRVPGAVVELHSHGQMPAFFSVTDDHDEQGFGIYGVIGNLGCASPPRLRLRLGIYGYFMHDLAMDEVFEGQPVSLEVEPTSRTEV